ncbi:MAG TPA: hypothetical protein VF310_00870 [Vicinamibacteria bacterium]
MAINEDTGELGHALDALSNESLPEVPVRLDALVHEAAEARAAVEGFLAGIDARLTEVGDLVPRVEATLRGLARLAADETLRLDHDRELGTLLDHPQLALEETLPHLTNGLDQRRNGEARVSLQGWEAHKGERSQAHQAAVVNTQARFAAGRERLSSSNAITAQGLQALQHTVEVTRAALTDEVERFGALMEAQQVAAARDVDELRRDLEGFEATVVSRVDRMREAVTRDADEMAETTRERMEELRTLAERAVKQLGAALADLDSKLKQAEDDAEETRESLVQQFHDLQEHLAPLRHALENVREAAHTVGIPL